MTAGGAMALGLGSPAEASERKVCFTNGTDQTVYFRMAMGSVSMGGGKRAPGSGACFSVADIREIRVSLEKTSPVLCRVTPQYGVRYELTSLRNCSWHRSGV